MLINFIIFIIIIFLLFKSKLDRSKQNIINNRNSKYLYKYKVWLSKLHEKNDKKA